MALSKTYAKYERAISYSQKVMANVENYVKGRSEGHTFKIHGTIGKVLS